MNLLIIAVLILNNEESKQPRKSLIPYPERMT